MGVKIKIYSILLVVLLFVVLIGGMLVYIGTHNDITALVSLEDNMSIQSDVKIGILAPLTGSSASHGVQGMKGVEFALSKIDNKNFSLQYIVEDTKSSPSEAVSAVNKLVYADKADIIIGWLSSSDALAVAPICEENNVLFLAIGTSTSKLSGSGNYIYRHALLSARQAYAAAEYISIFYDNASTCILYSNDETGTGYYHIFKDYMNKTGKKIILEENYDKSTIDMRTNIAKLKSTGCEVVYAPALPQALGYFLKQLRELDYSPFIVSNYGIESNDLFRIAGNLTNDITYTSFHVDEDFIDEYNERYAESPSTLTALVYDSMNILFDGIAEGNTNSNMLAEYLSGLNYTSGITGDIFFDEKHDAIKQVIMKKIRDEKFIELSTS